MHVLNGGGHVIVRFNGSNPPLFNRSGKPFPVLEHLRPLKAADCADWDVYFRSPGEKSLQKGRLCAIRKTREAAQMSSKILRARNSRQQRALLPETLEQAGYVCVYTTVNRHSLKTRDVLHLYRKSWQIEPTLKRLKKHHRNRSPSKTKRGKPHCLALWKDAGCHAGRKIASRGRIFFPWGYPIESPRHNRELQQSGQQVSGESF